MDVFLIKPAYLSLLPCFKTFTMYVTWSGHLKAILMYKSHA